MASIGEAKYAAAFHTAQMVRKTLSDLGYPQPPTYILVDNKVAHGIASNTIEPKRTKSIDMQYHWLRDRVQLREFIVIRRKDMYNLADFFTKPLSVRERSSVRYAPSRLRSFNFPHSCSSSRFPHSPLACSTVTLAHLPCRSPLVYFCCSLDLYATKRNEQVDQFW